jgi:hypothetical protein
MEGNCWARVLFLYSSTIFFWSVDDEGMLFVSFGSLPDILFRSTEDEEKLFWLAALYLNIY